MTVTANRFERRDQDLTRREIVTPEGVPLVFYIARAGDRAAAFLFDMFLLVLMVLAVLLFGWMIGSATGDGNVAGSVTLLGFFLMFCAGGKLFPESTKYTSVRARNYRRTRKGLEPLDPEDEPAAEIITDFQRRG